MSTRSVMAHAALAAAGLLLAAWTWVRAKQGDTGADLVVVVDARKRDVRRLAWVDDEKTVAVERREANDGDTYHWISSEAKKGDTVEKKAMRAGSGIDRLIDGFAPFRALRALGSAPVEKKKELGLAETKKTIAVAAGPADRTFRVGDTAYGSDGRYIEDAADGKVYLIKGFLLGDLENATLRYMERSLQKFGRSEIERVEIAVGGKTAEVVQQGRLEPGKAYWARARDREKKDDLVSNWMDKVLGLSALEYVGEAPNAQSVLTLTFKDARSTIGTMELLRAPKRDGKGDNYFARTGHTVVAVRLHEVADEVARDADKIIEPAGK